MANAGQPPPSESPAMDTNMNTNTADAASAPPATAPSSGLDLLFAASQVDKKPKEAADAEAKANAEAVPSTITVVSNGIGSAEAEDESASNSDDDEAPSSEHDTSTPPTDALNDQKVKSFPQVLQEILNTSEYESIARWLPDGLSFIIADKRRFSDEILPKYFRRVALFHSFIRKLNRYGFRRIKGSCKGEESSFAHNNFVRDKPWLCLKMNCKSKPSYHKGPSAKKKTTQHMTAAVEFEVANSLTNTGLITMTMPAPVPPAFMGGVGGMIDASSRVFVSTPTTYLPAVSASVLPMATSAIGPPTTIAAIQERQFLASMLPGHSQQRMLRERQMLMLQMRQRHQRQAQLQLLEEMSAYDGDHFLSSYDSYVQSSMMAQSRRDNMLRRNMFY